MTAHKKDIEKEVFKLITNIGMDIPSNVDDIVEFICEDVSESADDNWHDGDIVIAFRRWIESKT